MLLEEISFLLSGSADHLELFLLPFSFCFSALSLSFSPLLFSSLLFSSSSPLLSSPLLFDSRAPLLLFPRFKDRSIESGGKLDVGVAAIYLAAGSGSYGCLSRVKAIDPKTKLAEIEVQALPKVLIDFDDVMLTKHLLKRARNQYLREMFDDVIRVHVMTSPVALDLI